MNHLERQKRRDLGTLRLCEQNSAPKKHNRMAEVVATHIVTTGPITLASDGHVFLTGIQIFSPEGCTAWSKRSCAALRSIAQFRCGNERGRNASRQHNYPPKPMIVPLTGGRFSPTATREVGVTNTRSWGDGFGRASAFLVDDEDGQYVCSRGSVRGWVPGAGLLPQTRKSSL